MERVLGTRRIAAWREPGHQPRPTRRLAWALLVGVGLAVEALAPRVLPAQQAPVSRASARITVSATVVTAPCDYSILPARAPTGSPTRGPGHPVVRVPLPDGGSLEVASGSSRAVRVVPSLGGGAGGPLLRVSIEHVAN